MSAGSDGAFIGPTQNQYAILEDDGVGLVLYHIEEDANPNLLADQVSEPQGVKGPDGALDENEFSEQPTKRTLDMKGPQGPIQFAFDTPVQRIFSSPLGKLLLSSIAYLVISLQFSKSLLYSILCNVQVSFVLAE